MTENTISNWLQILTHGSLIGFFLVFVARMFSYVLTSIISWFKKAL